MKRFLLSVLCATTFACGSSSPSSPEPETTLPGDTTPRAPDAVGATPTDADLDEEHGIFVAPTGKDTAPGTRTAPLATLRAAMAAAAKAKKLVYACEGTYGEALEVVSAVQMVGGVVCTAGNWKFGTGRSKIASPTSPAMHAKDVVALTRIEGFEVVAPDGTDDNQTSIGLFAESSGGLVLANMRIASGNGKAGADGTNGIQLTANISLPVAGKSPMKYSCQFACNLIDGSYRQARNLGASVQCVGAPGHDGEPGGTGGGGGVMTYNFVSTNWTAFNDVPGNLPQVGDARSTAASVAGTDGISGFGGSFTTTGYLPGDGTIGTDGMPGHGGKGGDGSVPPKTPLPAGYNSGDTWVGWSGAGGGAGGCPGLAGTPGKGGGASIGALLVDSAIVVNASEIVSQDGGAGGLGSLGSDALAGSAPGVPSSSSGLGSYGIAGGRAGVSGHGSGGPSIAIVHRGTAPAVSGDSKLVFGKGGAGRDAVSAPTGGARTIPASSPGAAKTIESF